MTDKHLVIYHGDCADGFGAAWAVHMARISGDVEYVEGFYGSPAPDVADKHVYILDFSYPLDAMESILAKAKSLVWLDHHKTAQEIAAQFLARVSDADREKLQVVFDMNRSGAGLAWDHFHPGDRPPLMLTLIEDRDLWRFAHPQTRPFALALSVLPRTFGAWSEAASDVPNMVERGAAMQDYFDSQVKAALGATKHRVRLAGVEGLAANVNRVFASEGGDVLAQECGTFGLMYYQARDGRYNCSLRSCGDFDVAALAAQFGGGGHRNAAGFTCAQPVWERL